MDKKCIDVSAHNCRVPIDWPKVAAFGVQGAVIRAGYGNDIRQADLRFVENITGAIAAGLKVAVYWFSYADSVADVLKEWTACKQVIEPYRKNIKFVAFDYEYASVDYYKKIHGTAPVKELINAMANTFLNAVKADGYGAALYTNNDYRKNIFTAETLAAWNIWLADYSGGPDIKCFMQQTGSTGSVPGISGNVDMDTLFVGSNPTVTPQFECDTTIYLARARGGWYQFKVTSKTQPKVNVGSDGVATILPRCQSGNDYFYYIIAYGASGTATGVYVNDILQFNFKIK